MPEPLTIHGLLGNLSLKLPGSGNERRAGGERVACPFLACHADTTDVQISSGPRGSRCRRATGCLAVRTEPLGSTPVFPPRLNEETAAVAFPRLGYDYRRARPRIRPHHSRARENSLPLVRTSRRESREGVREGVRFVTTPSSGIDSCDHDGAIERGHGARPAIRRCPRHARPDFAAGFSGGWRPFIGAPPSPRCFLCPV